MSRDPVGTAPYFILASTSPRRKELLILAGFAFLIDAFAINEEQLQGEGSVAFAKRLSREKSNLIASSHPDAVVLGADTIVVLPSASSTERILGKPKNRDEARLMLNELSGQTHLVISGVSCCCLQNRRSESLSVITEVEFKRLSVSEIDCYIDTDEPYDKAGAYAAQGKAMGFIKRINGSYTNIIGLPLVETMDLLETFGILPCHGLA